MMVCVWWPRERSREFHWNGHNYGKPLWKPLPEPWLFIWKRPGDSFQGDTYEGGKGQAVMTWNDIFPARVWCDGTYSSTYLQMTNQIKTGKSYHVANKEMWSFLNPDSTPVLEFGHSLAMSVQASLRPSVSVVEFPFDHISRFDEHDSWNKLYKLVYM